MVQRLLPLATARRHGFPARFLAPQRNRRRMAKGSRLCRSMGLLLTFDRHPTPGVLNVADDRLPAGVDVDVLDGDLLLAVAPVPVQGLKQGGVGAAKFVRLGQALAPALDRLLADHGAPVAFHRGSMAREELSGQHAFQLVAGLDPDQAGQRGPLVPVFLIRVSVVAPECVQGLVCN
jgi:hypothetical protein